MRLWNYDKMNRVSDFEAEKKNTDETERNVGPL